MHLKMGQGIAGCVAERKKGVIAQDVGHDPRFDEWYRTLIVESQTMQEVVETAEKATKSQATILLLGESGVGKILVWSPRGEAICGAQMCGSVRSFPGARAVRSGKRNIHRGFAIEERSVGGRSEMDSFLAGG